MNMLPDERGSEEAGSWKNVVEKTFISARLSAIYSLFQGKIKQK